MWACQHTRHAQGSLLFSPWTLLWVWFPRVHTRVLLSSGPACFRSAPVEDFCCLSAATVLSFLDHGSALTPLRLAHILTGILPDLSDPVTKTTSSCSLNLHFNSDCLLLHTHVLGTSLVYCRGRNAQVWGQCGSLSVCQ